MAAPPVFAPFDGPPDALPPLDEGEIHLFSFPLDPPPETVAACAALLADDEGIRAARFRFPRHRRRFTVGRGVLRVLLGGYLGTTPRAVRFRYGEKGKPSLDGASLDDAALDIESAPSFNLSNSHERAVVGLVRDQPLGVDVEHLRPMADGEKIAERFFSATEREALRRAPAADKDHAFFRCWTRKEAYIKAVGDGLSMPLDRFDVVFAGDEPCRFLALDGDAEAAARWTLRHLDPAPGYVGALALPARGYRLRAFTIDPASLVRSRP